MDTGGAYRAAEVVYFVTHQQRAQSLPCNDSRIFLRKGEILIQVAANFGFTFKLSAHKTFCI